MARRQPSPLQQLEHMKGIPGLRTPRGWGLKPAARRARTPRVFRGISQLGLATHPSTTDAQYQIYRALVGLGMRDGQDFLFQPQGTNGVDFLFPSTGLAVVVTGETAPTNPQARTLDVYRALGVTQARVVFIAVSDAMSDPVGVTRDALSGIDRTAMVRL